MNNRPTSFLLKSNITFSEKEKRILKKRHTLKKRPKLEMRPEFNYFEDAHIPTSMIPIPTPPLTPPTSTPTPTLTPPTPTPTLTPLPRAPTHVLPPIQLTPDQPTSDSIRPFTGTIPRFEIYDDVDSSEHDDNLPRKIPVLTGWPKYYDEATEIAQASEEVLPFLDRLMLGFL